MSRGIDVPALVVSFEDTSLDPSCFGHREHIAVAWWLVRELELLDALCRFRSGILRLVHKAGAPDKYSETVTWAYLLLIRERVARGSWSDFETFAENNPDLFDHRSGALSRYYRPETLRSELARREFVLPDAGLA
ncbi:MAG: hypothetical protein JKY37_34820 [Nannocystaceae bacterium]|nr:hypothetical protein [Nannocystaceae bacterium]